MAELIECRRRRKGPASSSSDKSHVTGICASRVVAIFALMASVCGCTRASEESIAPPAEPPNLVVVLIDTLRADHTSVGGYERDTTPHLAQIASEGVTFTRHYSNAPWTKPSVATIITGLVPSAHGSRVGQFETFRRIRELREAGMDPLVEVLSDKHTTLAEHLKQAGYETSAYLTNHHITSKFGYGQGYDQYEMKFRADGEYASRKKKAPFQHRR